MEKIPGSWAMIAENYCDRAVELCDDEVFILSKCVNVEAQNLLLIAAVVYSCPRRAPR